MKKKSRSFQIASGLVLSSLFLIGLTACKSLIEVTVRACGPAEATDEAPRGNYCEIVGGKCQPDPEGCICKKK